MSIPTIEAGHTPDPASQVQWADAARQAQFEHWLHGLASGHGLHIPSLRVASSGADSGFTQ